MKLWTVYRNQYSDRRAVGTFSNEDKAKEVLQRLLEYRDEYGDSSIYYADIKEHELDVVVDDVWDNMYTHALAMVEGITVKPEGVS